MRLPTPSNLSLALALVAFGASTVAAEDHNPMWGDHSDFRLTAAMLESDYDYEASGTAAGIGFSSDGSESWDQSWRAGLVVQSNRVDDASPLGLSTGLGLFYTHFESDPDADEKFQALSAQLRIGLAVMINEHVHLEFRPFGGLGAARGEIGDDRRVLRPDEIDDLAALHPRAAEAARVSPRRRSVFVVGRPRCLHLGRRGWLAQSASFPGRCESVRAAS